MPHDVETQNIIPAISNPFGLIARANVQVKKLPEGDPAAIRLTRPAARLEHYVAERRHLLLSMRLQRDN